MRRSTATPSRDPVLTPRTRASGSPLATIKLEAPSSVSDYPHRLNFYDVPPPADTEVSLEDFETWAVERISVLDELDNNFSKSFADMEKEMRPILNKHLPLSRSTGNAQGNLSVQRERQKDAISHFILRLAFCQKPEDRSRFVRLETMLFKLRYEMSTLEERNQFVSDLNLSWNRASPAEVQELLPLLSFQSQNLSEPQGVYYKVDMEQAMELVRRRRVVLRRGKAYVPESLQLSMLAKEFSRRLEAALITLAKYKSRFKDDSRIEPVLAISNSGFSKSQFKADPSKIDGKFTAQSMDTLDKENYLPMCASMLHQNLKKTHHAYHSERLHYQRFLKFMGMPVEQAIQLYTNFYNDDKKRNEITYGVKHLYGLVGSRKDYPAYTCKRVYEDGLNAKPNEVHGCPFQRLSPDNLEKLLRQHGINDSDGLAEVKRHSRDRQIHLACSKTYELTHPDDNMKYDGSISSPNMYFERAWDFKKRLDKK